MPDSITIHQVGNVLLGRLGRWVVRARGSESGPLIVRNITLRGARADLYGIKSTKETEE